MQNIDIKAHIVKNIFIFFPMDLLKSAFFPL